MKVYKENTVTITCNDASVMDNLAAACRLATAELLTILAKTAQNNIKNWNNNDGLCEK